MTIIDKLQAIIEGGASTIASRELARICNNQEARLQQLEAWREAGKQIIAEDISILEEKIIGYLTKAQGIKGYNVCAVGAPVYEQGDRYYLHMTQLQGGAILKVPYYKETLEPIIERA